MIHVSQEQGQTVFYVLRAVIFLAVVNIRDVSKVGMKVLGRFGP